MYYIKHSYPNTKNVFLMYMKSTFSKTQVFMKYCAIETHVMIEIAKSGI